MINIDMENWDRKEHFEFFYGMDYPHYNITTNLDITGYYRFLKENKLPFYTSFIHAATKILNTQDALKMRIREGKVIQHDTIHPSFTDIKKGEELFYFVTVDYCDDIKTFSEVCRDKLSNQKSYFDFDTVKDRDDLTYISCIPWVKYSHISHTVNFRRDDSVPRISWGKYDENNGEVSMPFSVQVNHALADGLHTGRYINSLQKYLNTFSE